MKGVLLLFTVFCILQFIVSADPDIMFHGFTANTYTYYTNGYNNISELNCTVSSDAYDVNDLTVTWFYDPPIAADPHEDTDSNLLRFEDVATQFGWDAITYYCKAVYGSDTLEYKNSNFVMIDIKYNTTITVSYDNTTEIREIEDTTKVLVPVMTDNVIVNCNASTAKWDYTLDGVRKNDVDNPLKIDLFTIYYELSYACTNAYDNTEKRGFVKLVTLYTIGSGLYQQQQQDTYRVLREDEPIVITGDVSILCVSSQPQTSLWFYRGEMNTGQGERLTTEIESISSRGFLKLHLSRDLPANRTGYYYCSTIEYITETNTQYREHSILVSLPIIAATTTQTTLMPSTVTTQATSPTIPTTITQTTLMPSTVATQTTSPTTTTTITTTSPITITIPTTTTPPHPSVSIHLSYTPNYNTVFVGYDDVTITCSITTDSIADNLTIVLIDVSTGSILKSQIGNQASIPLELMKGNITHKCSVQTDKGSVLGVKTADLRVEDIYTQEVLNLHTIIPSSTGVRLVWETSYPQLANEIYIISVYSVNESIHHKDITTNMTEYYLTDVSYTFHYTITVEVMNRLHNTNNSNTQIYYIHNQLISKSSTLYGIIGLIAGVLILIVLVIIVVLLIIILVLKRKKANKTGYSKQILTNNEEDITPDTNKQYINLSNLEDSPNSKPAVIHSITKKPGYEKLTQTETPVTSPLISSPVDKDGYTMLDQLEVSLEPMASDKGDDIGLEDNELHQYENFGETLYQSTYNKYADNPHAILVPPNKYKNHLNSLLSNYRMEKEYRMLGGQDLRYDCSHALLPINKNKNKYKQIYPYDKSRVVLETAVESDYINAATIPGFHLSDTFIATQAPKTNTETDFWEMILEQRVCTIVMLTRVVEMGKEKSTTYWPKVVGSSSTFNNIEVTLHREDMYPSYIIRKLGIRGQDNRNYMITQFHYVTWPDHDVPQLYMNLLEFTQKVKQHRKKERTHLVVHCSAGVGRTGTFIALYNLIEGVNLEAPISVYRVVNEMREYRPQMVQTFNQYKFIYLAILELIFGTTSIPNGDYCETYKLYQQSHGDITDIFKEQFQELNYQTDHSFCYPQTAGHDPSNEDKNVVKDILPYDTNRVILYSPSWPCEYINASYIDSYELVATLFPTENTIQDYLQLVYQLEEPVVVLLFTQDEYQKVRSGMSNRVNYWLEESGRKDFDGFSVITEKSQNSSFLIQQKMKVLSSHENDEHSFTQFISPTWEETGRVTDVVGVLTLLELINKQQQNTPGRKLIICCSDGIGKSGVLLTVYNTIRGIQENSCIDVFQMVKQLRNSRKNMVPTLEHYLSCYHLINEYCQMNI